MTWWKSELTLHFTNVQPPGADISSACYGSARTRVRWGDLPFSSVTISWVFRTLLNKSDIHNSSSEPDSEGFLLSHEKQFLLEWYFNQNWSRMTWSSPLIPVQQIQSLLRVHWLFSRVWKHATVCELTPHGYTHSAIAPTFSFIWDWVSPHEPKSQWDHLFQHNNLTYRHCLGGRPYARCTLAGWPLPTLTSQLSRVTLANLQN